MAHLSHSLAYVDLTSLAWGRSLGASGMGPGDNPKGVFMKSLDAYVPVNHLVFTHTQQLSPKDREMVCEATAKAAVLIRQGGRARRLVESAARHLEQRRAARQRWTMKSN